MTIDSFRGSFEDLARPNRFKVILSRLGGSLEFLCKAAAAPAMTVGPVDVNYQGRIVKIAGDRTYADWAITIYGATDYGIYRSLKDWSDQINDPRTNTSAVPSAYKEMATVHQLDRNNSPVYTWNLDSVWPTEVGQIDFDWGTNDTPLEFTATFAFDFMTS